MTSNVRVAGGFLRIEGRRGRPGTGGRGGREQGLPKRRKSNNECQIAGARTGGVGWKGRRGKTWDATGVMNGVSAWRGTFGTDIWARFTHPTEPKSFSLWVPNSVTFFFG